MREEFVNRHRFHSEKSSLMFAIHAMLDEFKTATITSHLCLRKTWSGRSHDCHDYCDAIIFKMLHFHNVFCASPHKNEKLGFPNSLSLKSVFEKLCFCDWLECAVATRSTCRNQAVFSNFSSIGYVEAALVPSADTSIRSNYYQYIHTKELKPHVQCALFKQFFVSLEWLTCIK